jgi:hypothetical protein
MTATAAPPETAETTARAPVREAIVVALASAVLNLLLLVRVHNEAEDSIGYLVNIRGGHPSQIFNPYHLIHSWLGWFAFRIADALGYDGGPLVPVQVVNALIGAAGIGLLWLLMRRATDGLAPAIEATGIVALSYGYWSYSLGADVYVLSTALLIAALFAGYRAVLSPALASFAVFGLATGAAVLAHNTNVLFAVVGAMAILLATRDPRQIARYGGAYAAGVLVAVVPLYLVALATVHANTPSEANDWLTAYAQSGQWGNVEASSAPKAIVGAGRALVGGHFAFSLEGVRDLADRASGQQSLREETYLVRNYPGWLAGALFGAVAIAGVSLAWLAAQWLRRPTLDKRSRTLALLALAWLVPYALFVAYWEPVNPEFWIAVWAPAAILLAIPFSGTTKMLPLGVAVLLAALATVNLAGSIAPQLSDDNDYWRERTAWYEANATPADVVVTNGFIQSAYMRYFGRTNVIDIDEYRDIPVERGLMRIEERIRASGADRVLISGEVFSPADDLYSHCTMGERPCSWLASAVRERLGPASHVVFESNLETVWELNEQATKRPR